MCSRVTTTDGRSPGSRVVACRRLPRPAGPVAFDEGSPLTVAGAATALGSPRTVFPIDLPKENRRGHPSYICKRLSTGGAAGPTCGSSSRRWGKTAQLRVNPIRQKYSTLPKFGFVVCLAHPSPPKGRSYVVSSAGWELRWTRAAFKAGLLRAGRDEPREHDSTCEDGRRSMSCEALGPGALRQREKACVRRNRVVLAVVATVKPSRRRHARQPARWRDFRGGEGGQKELGSRESAA